MHTASRYRETDVVGVCASRLKQQAQHLIYIKGTYMKFEKTLIAAAVAGLALAPASVFAAGHSVAVSGIVEMQYKTGDTGAGDDDDVIEAGDVLVNVAASTTTNSGLEAFANIRIDGGLTNASKTSDNVWAGVRGCFG